MRIPRSLLVLLLAALLIPWPGSAAMASDDGFVVDIQISPETIVSFAERRGNWVTVHADLPYAEVDTESLTLNGVPITRTKPDDQGDLVAQVKLTELISILQPGPNALLFEGLTKDGTPFSGSDTVFVRKEPGKKQQ